ncbi:hypothetical protein [Amycolatopsis taiwanensis]|uniref:hypothetical protein n=1 Tax=Amycolatopsis taiwanensis TaxID=342230 RepID=UPI002554BC63|nr:hypothetical protein [Amycolatopsis taiwanensis]
MPPPARCRGPCPPDRERSTADAADQVNGLLGQDGGGSDELVSGGVQGDGEAGAVRVVVVASVTAIQLMEALVAKRRPDRPVPPMAGTAVVGAVVHLLGSDCFTAVSRLV